MPSKFTTGPAGSASRRTVLMNSVWIAGRGFILSAPAPRTALAQTKLTHEIAKYQDTAKNDQKYSTCVQFVTPASCKIVADPINPDGWSEDRMRAVYYGERYGLKQGLDLNALGTVHRLRGKADLSILIMSYFSGPGSLQQSRENGSRSRAARLIMQL